MLGEDGQSFQYTHTKSKERDPKTRQIEVISRTLNKWSFMLGAMHLTVIQTMSSCFFSALKCGI